MKRKNGWIPDFPDFRDYNMAQTSIKEKFKNIQKDSVAVMMQKVGIIQKSASLSTLKKSANAITKASPIKSILTETTLPKKIDLREFCSPVNNQGNLSSCTAHAAAGLLEYFENRAFGKHIKASPLFLYKATRNLLKKTGDNGAFIRATVGALALFGIPPEDYWKYDETKVDEEPTAFCYSFASNYQAINYYKLDTADYIARPDDLLKLIKTNLKAGLPSIFGFSIYDSYEQSFDNGGCIPFPLIKESDPDGHAVMAIGYDDGKKISNNLFRKRKDNTDIEETVGALLIKNSWGTEWGEEGYGWLPYAYVTKRLTLDWWSLLKNEWVDTGQFGL